MGHPTRITVNVHPDLSQGAGVAHSKAATHGLIHAQGIGLEVSQGEGFQVLAAPARTDRVTGMPCAPRQKGREMVGPRTTITADVPAGADAPMVHVEDIDCDSRVHVAHAHRMSIDVGAFAAVKSTPFAPNGTAAFVSSCFRTAVILQEHKRQGSSRGVCSYLESVYMDLAPPSHLCLRSLHPARVKKDPQPKGSGSPLQRYLLLRSVIKTLVLLPFCSSGCRIEGRDPRRSAAIRLEQAFSESEHRQLRLHLAWRQENVGRKNRKSGAEDTQVSNI